jgi:glycosyltransferase involved in cell wall biosynthesis
MRMVNAVRVRGNESGEYCNLRVMHIGFDISQTGAYKAGCGHFAHAMIETMLAIAPQHRYSLYPSFGDFFFDVNMPAENPYPGSDVSYGPRHATLAEARAFWNSARLHEALGRPDIVHANNFWCPPRLAESRLVYTLYDLGFLVEPAWTTEVNRKGCWAGVTRASTQADWIVAISQASRDHFLQVFPAYPAERVRIVHPVSRYSGTETGARPASVEHVSPGRFWLSVGTIEPRKNQRRIAEAYGRYLAQGGAAMPLVFAGGHGWLMDDFREQLEALGVAQHVIVTGYVSDAELAWLYRHCYANVYMSHFEGFGLPVLEGMQFGAPTIASNATSLPEVAGDAAILLAPSDVEGLAGAMQRMAADGAERATWAARAKEQAARFDARTSAGALLALYEEALAAPKRTVRRGVLGRLARLWRDTA